MPEPEKMKTLVVRAHTLRKSTFTTTAAMDERTLTDAFIAYDRSSRGESVAPIRSHLSHKPNVRLERRVTDLIESSGKALQIFAVSMISAAALVGFLCYLMVSKDISRLERFCISFAVGILLYEVLLVASAFWKGRQGRR